MMEPILNDAAISAGYGGGAAVEVRTGLTPADVVYRIATISAVIILLVTML